MDKAQLAAKIESLTAEISGIFAKADGENRPVSKEELASVDSKEAEIKAAQADLEHIAKAEKAKADHQTRLAALRPTQSTRGGMDVTDPASVRTKEPERFKTLGEQLQAIASVEMTGRTDNRLQWGNITPYAVVSGAGANVPSDGGYLIQQDLVTELMTKAYGSDEVLNRCRKIGIGPNSDGLKMNLVDETSRASGSRWGGVQVYWGAEADAATAKKPKFRQASWELKDVIGLMYATERLMADASALEAVFNQAFTEEIRFFVGDAVINGTGGGQMQGLLAATALVSVSKESGQPATTIQYENINKMWSRMWSRSRSNAVWLINQDCEPALDTMTAPVGTGGVPVYLPPGGLSQSRFASLKGAPVIPTEFNPTLGTVGDIMLVDLSQYLIIDKGGIQADQSIHVRFINNERTFRFIYRVDGAPLWNSALTPAKGSNTLSPFVALATRA